MIKIYPQISQIFADFVATEDTENSGGTTPEGTRTLNLRIDRPIAEDDKHLNSKDLQQNEKNAYKPAYKDNRNTLSLDGTPLPNELSEIIFCWSKLPEHVKQAICTLAKSSK